MVERGHKEKEVRKQVLRRRAICRDDLLNREGTVPEKIQIAFSLTSYPSFLKMSGKSLKNYLLLTPEQAHNNVFPEVPIIGIKNGNGLKENLVRAVLSQLDRQVRSKSCRRANPSCEVCESVKYTTKLKKAESEDSFVQLQSFDLYLITIKPFIVSLERNTKKDLFKKLKKVNLKKNHEHYCSEGMGAFQAGASPR